MTIMDLGNGTEVLPAPAAQRIDGLALQSAEIERQIATAKAYPRSLEHFRKSLLSRVTLSQDIAQQCVYALPRGGKKIEGPSVRLAEMVISSWGNCRTAARVIHVGDEFLTAQGVFFDLETNSAIAMEVQRRITDKNGKRYDADMIGVTGNAACAIALRNAILRGVPKALWWEAYEMSRQTAAGNVATLADRRKRAIEAFKVFGVTEAQICEALGIGGVADIGLEQLVTLGGYLTAIQTEEADPEDIFPRAQTKAQRAAPPAAAPKPQQAPPPPPPAQNGAGFGGKRDAHHPPSQGVKAADGPPATDQGQGLFSGADETAANGGSSAADAGAEEDAFLDELSNVLLDAKTASDLDQLVAFYSERFGLLSPEAREQADNMIAARGRNLAGGRR